ncbi:MAG: 1-deoxy-D-xylulose-5-phosphate reductoisomerase [Verrucomicrobiales bacterium]
MSRRKRVVILGSTGSIGESALKVASELPDEMEVVGMAAHRNTEKLSEQLRHWKCQHAAMGDATSAAELSRLVDPQTWVGHGEDGLCDLIKRTSPDLVLVAIVGVAGLRPALQALNQGCDLAVASKEILVMAGALVRKRAQEKGCALLPVDSEHNAIFQCLTTRDLHEVRKLILTASGGPFRTWPAEDLWHVQPSDALKHPTWVMGRKITVDSASLFNKGLEMIEARWLFDIEMARIDVLVHPQSLVHSMVEYIDGSILAQLSHSDMCFPIQYAVTWPRRVRNSLPSLDLGGLRRLEFEPPRWDDFPALRLAKKAGEQGQGSPAVLNAANEVAVEAFLGERLAFPNIWRVVECCLNEWHGCQEDSLEEVTEADAWARNQAIGLIQRFGMAKQ